jgi:hypothetical protein
MSESENAPQEHSKGKSPFGGELELETRPHKLDKDHLPPEFGRLNAAAISTPNALAGPPPGAETAYIKGKQTAHVTVDRTTIVDCNEDHTVFGTQQETIHGKTQLTYLDGRDVVVGNADQLSVNGTQEIFVLGESEETYVGKHEIHVPWEFERKLFEAGLTVSELKFMGGAISIRGREAAYTIQDLECAIFKAEEHILHEKAKAHEGTAAALTDTAAVTADVNARVDVAPDVGLGTPLR